MISLLRLAVVAVHGRIFLRRDLTALGTGGGNSPATDIDEAQRLELADEGDGILTLRANHVTIHHLSISFTFSPAVLIGGLVLLPPRNDGDGGTGRRRRSLPLCGCGDSVGLRCEAAEYGGRRRCSGRANGAWGCHRSYDIF